MNRGGVPDRASAFALRATADRRALAWSGTTVEALRRLIPLQEGARAVDGARLQLRRILPREHRDLGIRAERGDIDRSHQRMCIDGVRQYKHRRLARFREIARYAVHEIGLHAVKVVQIFLDGLY